MRGINASDIFITSLKKLTLGPILVTIVVFFEEELNALFSVASWHVDTAVVSFCLLKSPS